METAFEKFLNCCMNARNGSGKNFKLLREADI